MDAKSDKKNQGEGEGEGKPQYVLHVYKNRLQHIKEGHYYADRQDFVNAVSSYQHYLEALALFYGVKQDALRPSHFKRGDEDGPELMMISLVYWELAKIYDRNNKTLAYLKIALDQFVRFSLGYKYQFLNAENIRKYLHKGACIHSKFFEDAYKRIQVNSKKCFIATFTLGETHPDLEIFYAFRNKILPYKLGLIFVSNYYRFSPSIVQFLESRPQLGKFARMFFSPCLSLMARGLKRTLF